MKFKSGVGIGPGCLEPDRAEPDFRKKMTLCGNQGFQSLTTRFEKTITQQKTD